MHLGELGKVKLLDDLPGRLHLDGRLALDLVLVAPPITGVRLLSGLSEVEVKKKCKRGDGVFGRGSSAKLNGDDGQLGLLQKKKKISWETGGGAYADLGCYRPC